MLYSGDEVYDDVITSGQYYQYEGLTRTERHNIIDALIETGKFDRDLLLVMDDEELLDLADEYEI